VPPFAGLVAQMGIDRISFHAEADRVRDEVETQVIVLNGSSSSGKTTIARCLKAILPTPWISLSIDDLLRALPPSLMDSDTGIAFGEHGEITIGEGFRCCDELIRRKLLEKSQIEVFGDYCLWIRGRVAGMTSGRRTGSPLGACLRFP